MNPRAKNPERRWTETSEKRVLTKAFEEAGVDPIRPSEMGRHFFATEAVNDGANIYAVQEWLGHADPKTTERYAKLRAVPISRVIGDQVSKDEPGSDESTPKKRKQIQDVMVESAGIEPASA